MANLINKPFIRRSAKKYLEERYKEIADSQEGNGIKSVGVLFDLKYINQLEVLESIRKDLGLKINEWHILGFGKNEATKYSIPCCDGRNIGWNGTIDCGNFKEFEGRNFDLLLNLFETIPLGLELMSARVNARRRIGIGDAKKELNHIIIDTSATNLDVFKRELIKYLKVLGEL